MFHRESPHLPALKVLLGLLAFIMLLYILPWPWGIWLVVGGVFLAIFLFAAVAAFYNIANLYRFLRNHLVPVRRVRVRVTRKWSREYDHDVPTREPGPLGQIADQFRSPLLTLYEQWVFWISFDSGGAKIELCVPEGVFISLEEGMEGVLSVKGDRFIDFQSRPREDTSTGESRNTPEGN